MLKTLISLFALIVTITALSFLGLDLASAFGDVTDVIRSATQAQNR